MKISVVILLLLLLAMPLCAAEIATNDEPRGPIEVTSDQVVADQSKGQVVFSGHVVGTRGTMTIYAERLTLFLAKDQETQKITRLFAEGSVRLVDGDRIATADRLDYDQVTEKMVLTGQAEVHQGGSLLTGEVIEIYLKEERSLVKSGQGKRVRAVFEPVQEAK